jgi:F-type H+-transporting ATPase subunit b
MNRLFIAVIAVALCGWFWFDAGSAVGQTPPAEKEHADPAHKDGGNGAHNGDHAMPNPLGFDPDLAIWTVIIFVVLFLVLKKFAWKPIAHALEQRERAIESNIAKAENAASEARAMLSEYEKKLAGASDEVRAMLEEARRDAEQTKQEIVAEARVAARQEQDRALRDIGTAKDQALKELAERSADLAVELTGKLIRNKLTPEDHSGLVQEALNKFVAVPPSRN